MYEIHYRRNFDTPKDYIKVGGMYSTLHDAKMARTVSGDLVVDTWNGMKVVNDPAWLFDWEKKDPNCYAQVAIRHDNEGEAEEEE